jgi:hypothetical protein
MRSLISSVCILAFLIAQNSNGQINVGDTLQFWSVAYIDWQPDPPIEQRIINAVCEKIGQQCYVFVDTDAGIHPTSQQIESLVNTYDTSFVPNLPSLYGPVPDEFDNDPRIFILIIPYEEWTGYFDPAHQMADSIVRHLWGAHSNQKEIIYLSDNVFSYGADIVLAHEFGHMLHWGRDHSPEPPIDPVEYWEDAWIDEAFATFAPVYLIEDISLQDLYDNRAFFSYEPDVSLINFSNYNSVKLWMTFMFEHYGKDRFVSALINDQANGIEGVVSSLEFLQYSQSFNETFEQWIIANFLDDKYYLSGKYGYLHYNFPICRLAASHNQFPTGMKSGTVNSYAADYVLFASTTPRDVSIHFDGVDTSEFRLTFLKLGNSNSEIFGIESIEPDSLNSATFSTDSFGIDVKRIIMVVMNIDSSLGENDNASYTYSAEAVVGIEEVFTTEFSYNLSQNHPNPFNPTTTIEFILPRPDFVTLMVYNILGQEQQTLVNESKDAGLNVIEFNARELPSGVYFYRLQAGEFVDTKKLLLLR